MSSRRCIKRSAKKFLHLVDSSIRVLLFTLLLGCGGDGGTTGPALVTVPHRVFVAGEDSTLSVFEIGQDMPVSTLSLPGRPVSVAASPDGRRVYVGLHRPGGIVEYDAESLVLLRTISGLSMGLGLGVTPDGGTIVGTNQEAGLVTIISLETGELLDTLRVGVLPQYLRLDPTGRTAYVPTFGSDELVAVNVSAPSVVARIPLGDIENGPAGVALSPAAATAYVGTYPEDEYLQVVDLASRTVTNRIRVGGGTVDVDVTLDGRMVLLAQPRRIAVVDVTTAALTDSIPFGAFALAVPNSGDVFYAIERLFRTFPAIADGILHVIRKGDHMQESSFQLGHLPVALAVNFAP